MPEKKVLLSVCLPTYNQSGAVRKLLESLVPQYTFEIEIIVCDDSENSDTEEVVAEYQKVVQIRYFHRKKEGLDIAIIFLTEEARGLFVWWIGDDVIASGAIQEIISLIKKHEDLSFVWVNSHNIKDKNALTVSERSSYFFSDKNKILDMDIGLLGFISATIFKKELTLSGMAKARTHVGSAFVCMYIVLYVIAQGRGCYFLGTPCFASHPKPSGEVRWYDQFQVFGINIFHIVKEFECSFNKKKIRSALSRNLAMVVKAIIVERAIGLKTGFASPSPKLVPLARLYWSYWVFWAALPLLIMPIFILKRLYGFYRKMFLRDELYLESP